MSPAPIGAGITPDRLVQLPELFSLLAAGPLLLVPTVAIELGIPEHLNNGCVGIEELAVATKTHAPSLRRLMRALVSLGLCTEAGDEAFALAPLGSHLLADTPNSLRSLIIWRTKYHWPKPNELLRSVKTGEPARKLAVGTDHFGSLEGDPKAAQIFNGMMAEVTRSVAHEILRAYDFSPFRSMVDVGGGYGTLITELLQGVPDLQTTLFDRPHAMEGAIAQFAKAGLAARCRVVSGNFFEEIPGNADLYLLKDVLHDWDDEGCLTILRNLRRAMARDAKLLLVERMLPSHFEACARHRAMARIDLIMLVEQGGCERTEAQFSEILDRAGFALLAVHSTSLEYSLLEAAPC